LYFQLENLILSKFDSAVKSKTAIFLYLQLVSLKFGRAGLYMEIAIKWDVA